VLVKPQALAEADGDPFLGMMVDGRYAVLELLGAGSMAAVYRARHDAVRRDVALKIVRYDRLIDDQAVGRFQQEAHAMSMLSSPFTATVYDFGEINISGSDPHGIDGSLYLAMELLEGESLGDRLKRLGRLTPSAASRIAIHALHSLTEAHDKGVIHRDLKPDNLVLERDPSTGVERCKVLDFGIAKVLGQQEGVDALETQAGTVFGTPRYMSPEQAQGKPLDARSDLYSLGVILYHMLVGHAPYTDSDAVVVMAHHIKTPPEPPSVAAPDVVWPTGLEALLLGVLAKEPTERPQTAQQFIVALEPYAAVDASGSTNGQLAAVLGGRRRGRSRWGRLALLGVVLTALVSVVGIVATTVAEPDLQPVVATQATGSFAAAVKDLAGQVLGRVGTENQDASPETRRPAVPMDPSTLTEAVPPSTATPSAGPPKSPTRRSGRPGGRGYVRFDR